MDKIMVSTHDNDTKELGVSLNGSNLTVTLGDVSKTVDLSTLIPIVTEYDDFRLSSGGYDKQTKKLQLTSHSPSKDDTTIEIDLTSLIESISTVTGEQGVKGDKGDRGEKGETGATGAKGDKGEQGERGIQGLKGEKGDKGDTGLSAYQTWEAQGNTGTEADFLMWLKGKKGEDGRNGSDGKAGAKGESAYDIWLRQDGNAGKSEAEFLQSLQGRDGTDSGNNIVFGNSITEQSGKYEVAHDETLYKDAQGRLSVRPSTCVEVSNLQDPKQGGIGKLGFTCFYKAIETRDGQVNVVIGMPANPISDTQTQPAVTSSTQSMDSIFKQKDSGEDYRVDLTGWQVASPTEVAQIVILDGHAWSRSYNSGMHDNGDLGSGGSWSDWRKLDNIPTPPAQSGIDLSAIQSTTWKKGTEVLVKQDGVIKKMVTNASLFQEVGVAISANKLVADVGDKYTVTVTVTNTGEGTNEVTDLVITKPQLGTYTVSNIREEKSTGVVIENISEFNYKLKNLSTGATAKIIFDVVAQSGGTFQFGANINPNNSLDQQSNNNSASIILSTRLTQNQVTEVSVDCPLMSITYKGEALIGHSNNTNFYDVSDNWQVYNIIGDTNSLNNESFEISADSTVVVNAFSLISSYGGVKLSNDMYLSGIINSGSGIFSNATDSVTSNFTDYTLTGNTLRLGSSVGHQYVRISLRPKGQNCKWQHFEMIPYKPITATGNVTFTTDLPHEKQVQFSQHRINKSDSWIATKISMIRMIKAGGIKPVEIVAGSNTFEKNEQLIIKLPAGEVTSGYIQATNFDLTRLKTTGNIQTRYDTSTSKLMVTTTANVSAADAFVYDKITFKVV